MQARPAAPAATEPKMRWLTPRTLEWVVLLFFVAELVFWVLFRLVNLDEGWYLWAGKEVYRGRMLYRDFAYTQTPLLPYVYGLAQLVFGDSLYVGRILTAIFGLLAGLLSAAIARRLAGPWAAVFALAFLATTFLAVTAFGYTATYALAAVLLLAGFYVVLRLQPGSRRTWLVAGCLALATAARLSTVVVFVPLGAYVVLTSPRKLRAAVELLLAAVLLLALLLGPSLLASRDVMLYDLFGFHTDRTMPEWRQSVVGDKLWETFRDLLVPSVAYLAAVVALAISILRSRPRRAGLARYGFEVAIAAAVLLLFLAHLIPRTAMSYYNTLQISLVAVLVGAMLARWLQQAPRLAAVLVVGGLVVQLVSQVWVVRFYDLTTWPPTNQVEIVRRAAAELRRLAPDARQLLTFDVHLALEAGLEVPPGFEMSIFSYRPPWSTGQAQHYRVINNDMLLAAMKDGSGPVAFSQFEEDLFYGDRDALFETLHSNYRWSASIPGFDPFRNSLHIYLPRRYDLPTGATQVDQSFGDGIALKGYEVTGQEVRAGGPLTVAFYWRARQPTERGYTVFTHLLDTDETVVAGQDNPPCHSTCPTTSWQPGEVVRDEYSLELPETLPAGTYALEAGLYDPETMTRLSILDTAGETEGDRLVLGLLVCDGSGRCKWQPADKPGQEWPGRSSHRSMAGSSRQLRPRHRRAQPGCAGACSAGSGGDAVAAEEIRNRE